MPKIYGFNSGGSPGWFIAVGMAEDGNCLAQHCCSSEGFMRHDLGMNGESTWKHEEYSKHYPEGFETEFVPTSDIGTHEGLQAALKLNNAIAEATEKTSPK